MRYHKFLIPFAVLLMQETVAADIFPLHISKHHGILKRQTQPQVPAACRVQCAPIVNALTTCGSSTQCGCTATIANALPVCQDCISEAQRTQNAENSISATGDDPTTSGQSITIGALPSTAQYEQACASAGFPIGGTSAASVASSGNSNPDSSSSGGSGTSGSSPAARPNGNANTGSNGSNQVSQVQGQISGSKILSQGRDFKLYLLWMGNILVLGQRVLW